MSKKIKFVSTITCPICKFKKEMEMKTDSCLAFYYCEECDARLKPKKNDCCIFCSYGTMPCPAAQEGDVKKACN
jgi:hypothetical protein